MNRRFSISSLPSFLCGVTLLLQGPSARSADEGVPPVAPPAAQTEVSKSSREGAKAQGDGQAFAFVKNDAVAWLGSTFMEREGEHGLMETALTALQPGLNLRFRNLAWSGDTVMGHSRSYFDAPAQGLERLSGHLAQIKPTVIIINYGAVEAWGGQAQVGAFVKGYEALLDRCTGASGGRPRFVLVSPPDPEPQPAPRPSYAQYQKNLDLYRDAIADIAKRGGHTFVDLAEGISKIAPIKGQPSLTTDGLAFTPQGYAVAAKALAKALALPGAAEAPWWGTLGQQDSKLTSLQQQITEKNRLFFHRWRPQNETYLFGFRKHEQGQNGAEIPLFDPLIEAKEKAIAAQSVPTP